MSCTDKRLGLIYIYVMNSDLTRYHSCYTHWWSTVCFVGKGSAKPVHITDTHKGDNSAVSNNMYTSTVLLCILPALQLF